MHTNMGILDRSIRGILGLAIIITGIIYQSYWGLLGFIPLITSTIGFCPTYRVLNWSTAPKKKQK